MPSAVVRIVTGLTSYSLHFFFQDLVRSRRSIRRSIIVHQNDTYGIYIKTLKRTVAIYQLLMSEIVPGTTTHS